MKRDVDPGTLSWPKTVRSAPAIAEVARTGRKATIIESRYISPEAAPSDFEREVIVILAEEPVEIAGALLREGGQVGSCTSAEAADLLATSKLARHHGILPSSLARSATSGNRPVLLALHAAVRARKCLRFALQQMQPA